MAFKNAGIGFVVIVVIVVAVSFGYIGISHVAVSSSLTPPPHAKTNHTAYTHLWADASGWNYNHGPINPALYYNVTTMVYFNVTEEDNAPHTLTICYDGAYSVALFDKINSTIATSPLTWEKSPSYTIIGINLLTGLNTGQTVHATYPFLKDGIYTYWCTVHPTSMFGIIVVTG